MAVQRWGNLGKIVGVDLNPGMLDVARANTPATGVPIEWRQGDLSALPFPNSSFDVVLCNQGLQYVPDKVVALREILRVLAADGRLAVTKSGVRLRSWRRGLRLSHAMSVPPSRRVACHPWRCVMRPPYGSSWTRQGFAPLRCRCWSSSNAHQRLVEAVLEGMARSPYAREVAAVPEATRLALGQEVCAALHAYRDGDHFVLPCQMHLVQARVA